jgi:hypothetical protein
VSQKGAVRAHTFALQCVDDGDASMTLPDALQRDDREMLPAAVGDSATVFAIVSRVSPLNPETICRGLSCCLCMQTISRAAERASFGDLNLPEARVDNLQHVSETHHAGSAPRIADGPGVAGQCRFSGMKHL